MTNAAKRVKKSADAYRSIGEAAEELGLQPHVLRYWEGKFKRHLKPMKRPDGRRMFRPEDMKALRAIQILVHKKGFTLKGAAQLLNEQGLEAVLCGEANVLAANQKPGKEELAGASPARQLAFRRHRSRSRPDPSGIGRHSRPRAGSHRQEPRT